MTAIQFGNMQKLNGPTEDCEDPTPSPLGNCIDKLVRTYFLLFLGCALQIAILKACLNLLKVKLNGRDDVDVDF